MTGVQTCALPIFPLGLEGNGLLVPVIDGGGDSVHGHDLAHEGRGDANGEIPDEDVLVSDFGKGGVVLEVGYVFNEGWGIGVVFPLVHAFGGEPSNGSPGGIMVFERGFELCDEAGKSSHRYGGSRDSVLFERGSPSKGRPFGHIGESESNHFAVGVVDFVINEEVEAHSIQPLGGFVVRSVKGFWCSNTEFGGF